MKRAARFPAEGGLQGGVVELEKQVEALRVSLPAVMGQGRALSLVELSSE